MKLQFDGWSAEICLKTIPVDSIQAVISKATQFIELEITRPSSGSVVSFQLSEANAIADAIKQVASTGLIDLDKILRRNMNFQIVDHPHSHIRFKGIQQAVIAPEGGVLAFVDSAGEQVGCFSLIDGVIFFEGNAGLCAKIMVEVANSLTAPLGSPENPIQL